LQYKTRNTLILSSFLAILLVFGGYFVLWSYPNKIAAVEKELNDVDRQMKQLDGIENQFFELEKLLKEKETKLTGINKKVEKDITTADVYGYLNAILNYSGIIEFNLGSGENKNFKGFGYNVYKLHGEGAFRRIYNFIWYIEQGPHVYEITKVTLHSLESKNSETDRFELIVPFDMEIRAYYANVENLPQPPKTLGDVKVRRAKNPFYPYILRNIPANIDDLLEVERAALKAVIPGKALIADVDGKIHALREGDPVYLGYLTQIDTDKNEVHFTLNKGGIVEDFILKLEFENTKE